MTNSTIKTIIVDDHELIREGLKQILYLDDAIHCIAEGKTGKDALHLIQSTDCDVLLLDINMPELDGIQILEELKKIRPSLKIILLTIRNDSATILEAIRKGVDGYILKDSAGSSLPPAIHHVYEGGKFIDQNLTQHLFSALSTTAEQASDKDNLDLTDREIQLLYHISQGLSNKEISQKLFLSEKTIKNYTSLLFKKIGVKDRVQATLYALEHQIEKAFK